MKNRENRTGYILLELGAVAFLATGGIFVKFSQLAPINTGFYRVLFSLPLLLMFVYKELKYVSKKDWLLLIFAGVFLAGDIALWNLSFTYTTVANANLLTNLTPFTVVPLSYIFFKEKIPRFFLVGAGITLLGVLLLIGGKAVPAPENYFGDFLALCASFFYAGFLLICYHLRDRLTSSVIMFISGIGTTAALFLTAGVTEGIQIPLTFADLWPLLGLTIFLQVIGHNLLAHCQGKINVNLSSIICLAQPALASIYSFFFFGESITLKEMAGIAVVILGVYLVKAQYTKESTSVFQKQLD
ncbi:DMT family transporter [Enterococcus sp. BWM-S5]|uniref:DMT family transporter n=1 Tax=Enterococcus larvae TaxID=2794352 RepID=A0ABS4CHC8_9ENTE|nr:DMT family transporter [Enterococcus larvae]MBP1045551.1 DMT family transporter [Enterococcus larvae]